MLSKAPRYRGDILAHAQAVDTRPTSLSEVRPGIEATVTVDDQYLKNTISISS